MNPTGNPVITSLLVEEWHAKAQVPKPTALNTLMRYSGAHGCERQMSYYAVDTPVTEPVDAAGAWVMGVGTVVHELVQEAIGRRYPNAEFEVATKVSDYISGSCDAFIPESDMGEWWAGGNVMYELKTMGTYSFDKQVGWNRMRGTAKDAEGPKAGAIAQAGMNALGIEKARGITIGTIIMGSMTFEALSVQKAGAMEVSDLNRVLAEFHIPREEWLPQAEAEIERLNAVAIGVVNGILGARVAIGDNGDAVRLNPQGRDWQCAYCSFRSICIGDGDGVVLVSNNRPSEETA